MVFVSNVCCTEKKYAKNSFKYQSTQNLKKTGKTYSESQPIRPKWTKKIFLLNRVFLKQIGH